MSRTPKIITQQPGYRTGATWRVAKSTTGGARLYVDVSVRWMDASLADVAGLVEHIGKQGRGGKVHTMSTTKHTPGLWISGQRPDGSWQVYDENGLAIADCGPTEDERESVSDCWVDESQQPSNARLIAAAPAMLAALKELIQAMQDVPRPEDQVIAAACGHAFVAGLTAIAKAEGRT